MVGYTLYDADDVDLILDEFGKFWQGCLYDPFRHNWNDFARAVIQHLAHEEGAYEYPEYVNRFSKFSSVLRMWFEPLKNLFGDIVNAPEGEDDEEEKDIEQGANKITEKDENFEESLREAKKIAENSNSFYITGFYDNARNWDLLALQKIIAYSNEILEIKELRLKITFHLATCCQKLNKIDEVIEYCTQCIVIDPYNSKYFMKRGLALAYHLNEYMGALDDLSTAHALDPSDPVIIDEVKKVKVFLNANSGEAALLGSEEEKEE